MQATAIVREAWELYKAHWRAFVPLALVVFLILGLITLLLGWIAGWLGLLISGLASLVGYFWLQGAYAEAVRDVRDGRQDLSMGDTFRRVQPRLPALIVAGIIAGIAIFIGFLLLIVPGLFLLTIWCLIVPAIVIEGKSAGESFGRSRELVRGNGWNVFGVIVITVAIAIVAGIILGLATFWLPDGIESFVQNVVSNTIVAPFVAVAWNLMYWALSKPIEGVGTQTVGAAPPQPPAQYEPPPPAE
jgi:hypothetical protein